MEVRKKMCFASRKNSSRETNAYSEVGVSGRGEWGFREEEASYMDVKVWERAFCARATNAWKEGTMFRRNKRVHKIMVKKWERIGVLQNLDYSRNVMMCPLHICQDYINHSTH